MLLLASLAHAADPTIESRCGKSLDMQAVVAFQAAREKAHAALTAEQRRDPRRVFSIVREDQCERPAYAFLWGPDGEKVDKLFGRLAAPEDGVLTLQNFQVAGDGSPPKAAPTVTTWRVGRGGRAPGLRDRRLIRGASLPPTARAVSCRGSCPTVVPSDRRHRCCS